MNSIYGARHSLRFPGLIQGAAVALFSLTAPALSIESPASSSASSPAEISSEACLDAVYQANQADQTPDAAVEICQQAIDQSQAADNRWLEAYSRGNLGSLYLQQSEPQQAIPQFEQVLALAQQIADPALEVKALVALGAAVAQLQQPQAALEFYQQALTVAEAADPTSRSIVLYNQGLMYDRLGQTQQAVTAYQQAEQLATDSGDIILAGYAAQKLAAAPLGALP